MAAVIGTAVFLVVSLISAVLFVIAPQNPKVSASPGQTQGGALSWDPHQRMTVLLLGVSSARGARSPAQTMMVMSYDPQSRSAAALSIPPDLWVTVPGFGPSRVGDAYLDGGPRLALMTVEGVLSVPIPYYLVADSSVLKQLVDTVDGITVDLPSGAGIPLPGRAADAAHPDRRILDGASTLRYLARAASPTETGQQVLLSLKDRVLDPDHIVQMPALIDALGPQLRTNFPLGQMGTLTRNLAKLPDSAIQTGQLDAANGTVSDYKAGGSHVLLPDWQSIRSVARVLFPVSRAETGAGVSVLNGSGVPGQAAVLAEWLGQTGVHVSGFSSAGSFNYTRTQVIVTQRTITANRVGQVVATLLQAPLVAHSMPGRNSAVVVIIGRDYQNPTQQ
jgi:LCP family protein required for cell wall assembly